MRRPQACLLALAALTLFALDMRSVHAQSEKPRTGSTPPRQRQLFPPKDLGLLSAPDRDDWNKPDLIMDTLGIADGATVADLMRDATLRSRIRPEKYVTPEVGLPTLNDILAELAKPGRDPREKFEAFSFTEGVNKPEDLRPGMKLPGIVTNVTAFGAFVDVGVHQDGLVHVSQLADSFVKDPAEVVKPQQKVMVTVLEIDLPRQRIALSMRSNPVLGPKTAPGAAGPRTGPGPRPGGGPRPAAPAAPRPPQNLSGDWFSAALNKKR